MLAQLITVGTGNKFRIDLITVPIFTGVIGYITNWSGVVMLFQPVRFHGVRAPGLKLLWPFLPRRVQAIRAISMQRGLSRRDPPLPVVRVVRLAR